MCNRIKTELGLEGREMHNQKRCVGCSEESETSRQTGDGAKQTFERLRKVVRNVVFVDLNHCPQWDILIRESGLPAYPNDRRIVGAWRYQLVQRIRCDGLA